MPLESPPPGTPHSPAPAELVTAMDGYAELWMHSNHKQMFVHRRERPPARALGPGRWAFRMSFYCDGFSELRRHGVLRSSHGSDPTPNAFLAYRTGALGLFIGPRRRLVDETCLGDRRAGAPPSKSRLRVERLSWPAGRMGLCPPSRQPWTLGVLSARHKQAQTTDQRWRTGFLTKALSQKSTFPIGSAKALRHTLTICQSENDPMPKS
jgi:hypothetical protein